MSVKSFDMNNGMKIPSVGLGMWKIPKDKAAQTIYDAIKQGYRLFDGAADYGNEVEVGDGFKRAIDEGLVKREELFIVSKLWNNYHHPDNVKKLLNKTLTDLKLDYLDLYLIHFPISFKFVPFEEKYPPTFYCGDGDNFHYEDIPILDTWRAMEGLVEAGKVKAIGVSNFSAALIQDLVKSLKIFPSSLQIEHHPYLQQPELIQYLQKLGIVVTAYSSFGPQSFLELQNKTALDTPNLFEHDTIKSIATKHKVDPAKVLLRWANQRGLAIIPKSNSPARLLSNLVVDDFDLDDEDFAEIAKLDKHLRFNDPWDWDNIPIFY